jgi:hypothetical protein
VNFKAGAIAPTFDAEMNVIDASVEDDEPRRLVAAALLQQQQLLLYSRR